MGSHWESDDTGGRELLKAKAMSETTVLTDVQVTCIRDYAERGKRIGVPAILQLCDSHNELLRQQLTSHGPWEADRRIAEQRDTIVDLSQRLSEAAKALTPERRFPIQASYGNKQPHPLSVPWSVAEKAFSIYAGRHGASQSIDRIAQRGGFGAGEMDDYYPPWREETSENLSLRQRLVEAEQAIQGGILVDQRHLAEAAERIRDLKAKLVETEGQRDAFKALTKVGTWHDDCRPNRQQAGRELAKSQAVIDKLADRISVLEQALADAEARGREIECPWCGEIVTQVASATLSIALWQHVNWKCNGRPLAHATPSPATTRTACINCGETHDAGYLTEELGPFCAECWGYVQQVGATPSPAEKENQ